MEWVGTGQPAPRVPAQPYVRPRNPSRRKPKVKDRFGRNTSAIYRRKIKELKAKPEGSICWRCGQPIDLTLPTSEYNSAAYWTADHDPPLDQGGTLLEGIKPAHRGCNSAAGRQQQLDEAEIEHSREW